MQISLTIYLCLCNHAFGPHQYFQHGDLGRRESSYEKFFCQNICFWALLPFINVTLAISVKRRFDVIRGSWLLSSKILALPMLSWFPCKLKKFDKLHIWKTEPTKIRRCWEMKRDNRQWSSSMVVFTILIWFQRYFWSKAEQRWTESAFLLPW